MEEKIFSKLEISEIEKENFAKLKDNYYITDNLFYKDNVLYKIKILLKNNKITYQLKRVNKIIIESKNPDVIKNKILKILEK